MKRPRAPSRRKIDTDDADFSCPCDNNEDCCSCMGTTCGMLRNPAVFVFLFCLCLVQGIIILNNMISSTNRTASQSKPAMPMARYYHPAVRNKRKKEPPMPKLDWQFNTVIKVASKPGQKGAPLYQNIPQLNSTNSRLRRKKRKRKLIPVNDVIPYGSEDFQFPMLVDLPDVVEKVKRGERLTVNPVNPFNFPYIVDNRNKCADDELVDIVIVIKSAPGNVLARHTIRETWGQQHCWGGRVVKRVFLLGSLVPKTDDAVKKLAQIAREVRLYNDIVQADFVDHYFNNTYKLMMGFEWATTYCLNAKDIFFVDDDYLVHPKAVVAYLESISEVVRKKHVAGYVWRVANPVRRKRGSNKRWYVALSEYPWRTYPAYCSAGAFFVSMEVAKDLVIASRYTRYLRFDDVFLGLVLHKMLILPIHLTGVYSFNTVSFKSKVFKHVMASHGFKNPNDIIRAWLALESKKFCVRS